MVSNAHLAKCVDCLLVGTRYGMMGDKGQDQGFEEASSSSSSSSWRTHEAFDGKGKRGNGVESGPLAHIHHHKLSVCVLGHSTTKPVTEPAVGGGGCPSFRPATTMPEAPKFLLSPASLPDEHRKALEFIEDVTANADQVQRRVLAEILAQNAPAEYLHRHGLPGRTAPDPDAFKRLIPVVTYEDIRPDILRIAHGDTSPILSGRPISEFLTRFAARSHMYPLGK
ncbi:hypothetical protein BHE74_00022918 [Ensete ventricosum]|nr:hypothetical protein BHE74_00022918 [Ensete ventricosum]